LIRALQKIADIVGFDYSSLPVEIVKAVDDIAYKR
jgi:hypothetical protein